jgi:hypothetical protein
MIQYEFDYYYNYHCLLFYRHTRIGHSCGYNYSFINHRYIISSIIMFILQTIYNYVANMHVWIIISSVYNYEQGASSYYKSAGFIYTFKSFKIAKIILALSAERANTGSARAVSARTTRCAPVWYERRVINLGLVHMKGVEHALSKRALTNAKQIILTVNMITRV